MNKKVLIALIASFSVLVVAAFAYPMIKANRIKSDPINYLLYASANSSQDSVDMSVKTKVSVDDTLLADMASSSEDPKAMSEFAKNIVNEMSINGRVKLKMELAKGQMNFQEDFNFKYGENSVLSMNMGYIDGDGFMTLPELYNKSFLIKKDQVVDFIEEQSGLTLDGFKFANYTKHFDVKNKEEYKAFVKNAKIYETPFRTMLSDLKRGEDITVTTADGKEFKCDTLTLELDMKKFMQGYSDIVKVAKTDENFKALTKSILLNLLKELKTTGDYTKFNMDEATITAGIEDLEKNFNEQWDTGLENYIQLFEDSLESIQTLPEGTSMNLTIAIDKKYIIRQYKITTKAPGMEITQEMTINNIGSDVTFDKPKNENALMLMDLIQKPEEMEKIYQDVVNVNIPAYLKSENFKKITDDIKAKAAKLPQAEQDMIKTTLDGLADSYSMLTAFMPNPFSATDEEGYGDEGEAVETTSVGDEVNGFFNLPVGFESSTAEFGISYVHPESGSMVNVFTYDIEATPLEDLAKEEAASIKENFPEADTTPTETYFAGYPAFEIYLQDEDTFIDVYIFEDENGVKRSVQIIATFDDWINLSSTLNESFQIQ